MWLPSVLEAALCVLHKQLLYAWLLARLLRALIDLKTDLTTEGKVTGLASFKEKDYVYVEVPQYTTERATLRQ